MTLFHYDKRKKSTNNNIIKEAICSFVKVIIFLIFIFLFFRYSYRNKPYISSYQKKAMHDILCYHYHLPTLKKIHGYIEIQRVLNKCPEDFKKAYNDYHTKKMIIWMAENKRKTLYKQDKDTDSSLDSFIFESERIIKQNNGIIQAWNDVLDIAEKYKVENVKRYRELSSKIKP